MSPFQLYIVLGINSRALCILSKPSNDSATSTSCNKSLMFCNEPLYSIHSFDGSLLTQPPRLSGVLCPQPPPFLCVQSPGFPVQFQIELHSRYTGVPQSSKAGVPTSGGWQITDFQRCQLSLGPRIRGSRTFIWGTSWCL